MITTIVTIFPIVYTLMRTTIPSLILVMGYITVVYLWRTIMLLIIYQN